MNYLTTDYLTNKAGSQVQKKVTCNLLPSCLVYNIEPDTTVFVDEIKTLVYNHPIGVLKVS